MSRRRLAVGNWKMTKTAREGAAFAEELLSKGVPDGADLALAPPFPALESVGRVLMGTAVELAAQDVSPEASGAFTGEVSAAMLADLDVSLAIVGHSERRQRHGEKEPLLTRKLQRLVERSVAPIYCVGETLGEREAGATLDVLERQMAAFDAFGEAPSGLVLAYEPVWAIGTGRAASPAMASEAHACLRRLARARWGDAVARDLRILYGGSVTPENAPALFSEEEIDGALIGGASLEVESFLAIAQSAAAEGRR